MTKIVRSVKPKNVPNNKYTLIFYDIVLNGLEMLCQTPKKKKVQVLRIFNQPQELVEPQI